ncbi:MAG TPA: hypothetical protein VN456_03325 [Desulfosporosinus sp.]|nr:hypothetical protein [Desulfosporosinus sp.]
MLRINPFVYIKNIHVPPQKEFCSNTAIAFFMFSVTRLIRCLSCSAPSGTALTIGLFEAIQVNIKDFYINNIVIYGVAASPFVGTYLAKARGITKNIAPYLAKVFSPLVLITLGFYLATIIVAQKNPYTDREFINF